MKIALDIDDVLAGFAKGMHEYFDQEIEPHNHWSQTENSGVLVKKSLEEKEHKESTWENWLFWNNLEAVSLPIDIDFTVACYITSSPKEMIDIRKDWLIQNGFPKAPVLHSKEKWITMKRLGVDVLIDDRLYTVEKVRESGLQAIHFSPWYSTLREINSITNLSQVSKILENL